jgi:hypothetical protein
LIAFIEIRRVRLVDGVGADGGHWQQMKFHAGAAFYDLEDVASDGSAVHSCAANAVDVF